MPFLPRDLIIQYAGGLGGGGGGIGSGCTFSTSDPVPENHGGLESGTTITGLSACEVLQQILYPYQYPSFTAFYMDSQSTTLEVGDKVVGGTRSFRWNTSNSSNIQSGSIEIRDLTGGNVLVSNLDNDGQENVDIGNDKVLTSSGSYTWQIRGLNTKNETFTRNYSVRWYYRVYWGPATTDTLDEAAVKALSNSQLKSSFAGTYNFNVVDGEDYYYIVYPDSWGSIGQAVDCDNGFGWDMSEAGTVNITNDYGVTTTYRLLRTTYKQTADGCVNIS